MPDNVEPSKNKFLVHIWNVVDGDGHSTGNEVYRLFNELPYAIGYVIERYPEYDVDERMFLDGIADNHRYVADIHINGGVYGFDHIGSIIEIEEYSYE